MIALSSIIDRAQALQDRIEARARRRLSRFYSRFPSGDYIEGLAVGGSVGSLFGAATMLIVMGAL